MGRFSLLLLLCSACGDDIMQVLPTTDAPLGTPDGAGPMPDAAPPDAAPDGPKFISQPAATLHEHEPMIAATGQGKVVAAWIGYFSSITTNGYAVSQDDGATWARPQQIDSPGARGSGDPVVAADAAGNFYLSWIGFRRDSQGNPTDAHIYSATMPTGSSQFGTPVEVTNPNLAHSVDKNWVTVLANGTVLVTWADLTAGNYALFAATSVNQGATFARHVIEQGAGLNLLFPCSDQTNATSPVFAVASGANTVFIYRSVDDGVTWTAPAGNQVSSGTVYQDATCAVQAPRDVWVLYPIGTAPFSGGSTPPADVVRIAHSTDSAATWATKIGISAAPSGQKILLPQLARSASGQLHAVWYEGAMGGPATLIHAASTDGSTWTRTAALVPGTFTTSRSSVSWLGDYIGIFAAGPNIYVDFVDNSDTGGTAHISFARFAQ